MEDLANMALALALTRTMLSLPYRDDAAEDLERVIIIIAINSNCKLSTLI